MRVYPHDPRAITLYWWHFLGQDVTIGGITYQGGRWSGPLAQTEIAAITAAGYGARLYAVADLGQLPSSID